MPSLPFYSLFLLFFSCSFIFTVSKNLPASPSSAKLSPTMNFYRQNTHSQESASTPALHIHDPVVNIRFNLNLVSDHVALFSYGNVWSRTQSRTWQQFNAVQTARTWQHNQFCIPGKTFLRRCLVGQAQTACQSTLYNSCSQQYTAKVNAPCTMGHDYVPSVSWTTYIEAQIY